MQALSAIIDRKITINKMKKSITFHLGKFGHLLPEDDEILRHDPLLVQQVETRLILEQTGDVDTMIDNFANRYYCHGRTPPLSIYFNQMAKYGHYHLFDQVEGDDYGKCCVCIKYRRNDLVEQFDFSNFEADELEWLVDLALSYNNCEMVTKLINHPGVNFDPEDHVDAIVKSNNPEFLNLLSDLGLKEIRNILEEAFRFDADAIFQTLYPQYIQQKAKRLRRFFLLAIECQAEKILTYLIQENPDYNFVENCFSSDFLDKCDHPNFHQILLSGNEKIVDLVLGGVVRFCHP